jgi:hypothetical protein
MYRQIGKKLLLSLRASTPKDPVWLAEFRHFFDPGRDCRMGRIFCPQRGLTHIALVIELVMLNFYLGSSQQLFGVRYFCEALTVLFRITPDY